MPAPIQTAVSEADHVYLIGADSPRLARRAGLRAVSRLPSVSALSARAARGVGPALVVGDPTGDLAGARREARWVAEALEARLVAGAEATHATVVAGLAGATVFHFAGHGEMNDDPWLGHLRLAGRSLTVLDVLTRPNTLDVAVLSGCRTGVRVALSGQHALGLPDAFMLAGTRSVISTTRPVPDALAERIARLFYQHEGARRPASGLAAVHAALPETRDLVELWGRPD